MKRNDAKKFLRLENGLERVCKSKEAGIKDGIDLSADIWRQPDVGHETSSRTASWDAGGCGSTWSV